MSVLWYAMQKIKGAFEAMGNRDGSNFFENCFYH